jgi:hypothetical protein
VIYRLGCPSVCIHATKPRTHQHKSTTPLHCQSSFLGHQLHLHGLTSRLPMPACCVPLVSTPSVIVGLLLLSCTGGMRQLHWHLNFDEWQFVLNVSTSKGKAHQSIAWHSAVKFTQCYCAIREERSFCLVVASLVLAPCTVQHSTMHAFLATHKTCTCLSILLASKPYIHLSMSSLWKGLRFTHCVLHASKRAPTPT